MRRYPHPTARARNGRGRAVRAVTADRPLRARRRAVRRRRAAPPDRRPAAIDSRITAIEPWPDDSNLVRSPGCHQRRELRVLDTPDPATPILGLPTAVGGGPPARLSPGRATGRRSAGPRRSVPQGVRELPEVDVRLVDVVKKFGDDGRRRPHQPRGPRRRVLQPARPVGLRQDDDPPDDRRVRAADVRPDRAPGPGRDVAAAVQAERQHRLPELRPLPPPDDLRERRLRAAPEGRQGHRGQEPGHRHAASSSSCPASRTASRPRSPAARPSASRSPGP